MSEMKQIPALKRLQESLRPLRDQLMNHEVYRRLKTPDDLQIFMEHHVFAVWDFMSLLKTLQQSLTCVAIPWVPQGDPNARRLINEIVLEEESDEDGQDGYISHFELYHAAMVQCGADTSQIDNFLVRIHRGEPVQAAIERGGVPRGAQAFVKATWQIIESEASHRIAAAFTFGREDLVPVMFRPLVTDLQQRFPGQWNLLHHYLERHIALDEGHHTPLALRMLVSLCAGDQEKWQQADETSRAALHARVDLWDSVVELITTTGRHGPSAPHSEAPGARNAQAE